MAKCAARFIASVFLAAGIASIAGAQEFPSQPITLVVPFGAGGITDQTARLVAEKVTESTGQPVIIDNRPGGGGSIGAVYVKNAKPDGYTLFLAGHGSFAVNLALHSKWPIDPIKDFEPITTLIEFPMVLTVPFNSPVKTAAELVALAKAKPGTLAFASQGVGFGGHLMAEMLKSRTGIDVVHVPYKGTSHAIPDVLAGRVDFIFDGIPGMGPLINQKKLRGLALTDSKRAQLLSDTPTMAEAGFSGFEFISWFGLAAPAGTPKPVIDKLNTEITKALRHPDTVKRLAQIGVDVAPSSPAEFATRIATDIERLGKVARDAGVKVD
jgi:tripartite-type tricarboxylate transporter receptor subunit TctC